jgi:hypothetical protein
LKLHYLYLLFFLLGTLSNPAWAATEPQKGLPVITPALLTPGSAYLLPMACQRQTPVHNPFGINSHHYRVFCSFESSGGEFNGCQIDIAVFTKINASFAIYTCTAVGQDAKACPAGSEQAIYLSRDGLSAGRMDEFPGDLNEFISLACPH